MAFEIENGVLTEYIPEDGETEVIIPEGVTSIGNYAFDGCSNLISVTIPESVIKISCGAFYECEELHTVHLPENLQSIGKQAFYSCDRLADIRIPESVTHIGEEAFCCCECLTNIRFPEGITEIGMDTFFECESLTGFIIPSTVKSIGMQAFLGCADLYSMHIPEQVEEIGKAAFRYCSNLHSMTIAGMQFHFADQEEDTVLPFFHTARYLRFADAKSESYLKNHAEQTVRYLICHNNPIIIQKLLDDGVFINVKNIDTLIGYAIEKQMIEIQMMLLHYKHTQTGYKDPANLFEL